MQNRKRTYRLYRSEGLRVQRKPRKGARKRVPGTQVEWAQRPNECWAMDFLMDHLADGRKFRSLDVLDECTRECLVIELDHSLTGARVVKVLEKLVRERGKPELIRVDNGPELRGSALEK